MTIEKKGSAIKGNYYFQWIPYLAYGSVLLYFGRNIFIPVSFALLISFVLFPVCSWLEKKGLGRFTAIIISVFILVLLGVFLLAILIYQFMGFLEEWPSLQLKLTQSIKEFSQLLTDNFGITKDEQENFLSGISDSSGSNLLRVLTNTISTSVFSIVLFILIPVYAILILFYRGYWMKVLYHLFPAEGKENLRKIIGLTIKAYYNFIKGMALVYLIVGILNSIGLVALGIPHAILFGFIASILTFIPYIGIIAGSLLPIAVAWITYDSFWYPFGVIAIFTFVQYLEANVIFPLAVSNRLNVNALVMLLAIFTGGTLWGMAGMILFVPFVGIAKLIADYNPRWKKMSLILGVENSNKLHSHEDK